MPSRMFLLDSVVKRHYYQTGSESLNAPILLGTIFSVWETALLRNLIKNKGFTSPVVVFVLMPYLFLCLTLGGFHENIFNGKHCDYTCQSGSMPLNAPDDLSITVAQDSPQHDSASCQICHWLKTPSTPGQIFLDNTPLDYVIVRVVCYSNPIIPFLPLRKFTIRPPPSSCLFI